MSDVAWEKGGDATIEAFANDVFVVRSTIASAPGSTLAGKLVNGEIPIAVKVRSCKRDGDAFRIEGRAVSITKSARAAAEAIVAARG